MKIRESMRTDAVRRLAKMEKGGKGKATKEAGENRSDTIAISSSLDQVAQVKDAAREVPDVRMEKVAPLKEKVDKGEYHVSAEDIADKFLEHVIKHRMRN